MEKLEKQAIELLQMMCGSTGCVISDSGGKDGDDEPIERCKRCIACTSFDWEEEKERLKL